MFLIFCAAGMWLARDRPHFTRVVGGGVLRLNAQPPSPPQHQQQQQLEQQQQQPPETYLPLALAHVLVCATFHWNVQKLIYLEMLLRTAATYRTRVDALLVTDSARSLEAAIGLWDGSFKPEVQSLWRLGPPGRVCALGGPRAICARPKRTQASWTQQGIDRASGSGARS
ncbi:hypothetical protein Rsub_12604 [Raphidocelis subcapitata]|uniref:Uncharacterized protein n=1 Tax=Raphidocelis subcapitata TaxID=307507 RepID=A0A2V0PGH5_9CHLO|nr:hypothetical protein Rsub_12604 [Raphidocelis subcapitata]|eukprot:GBF98958.1 hypothetical protein Rsub_12604 [Raphidocelis subcapitata]